MKKIIIIIETKTGYINKIVHAIPTSMCLKASNRVNEDNEKINRAAVVAGIVLN